MQAIIQTCFMRPLSQKSHKIPQICPWWCPDLVKTQGIVIKARLCHSHFSQLLSIFFRARKRTCSNVFSFLYTFLVADREAIVAFWVLIPLANNNQGTFYVPKVLKNLTSPPKQTKSRDKSSMVDWI